MAKQGLRKLEIDQARLEAAVRNMAAPLLEWFQKNARILPWRSEPTPYRVWISEIMLQQTRVSAVLPYFERFMTALPDIHALAQVSDEELLVLWQGLGYYSRARNLKRAAQQVVRLWEGERLAEAGDTGESSKDGIRIEGQESDGHSRTLEMSSSEIQLPADYQALLRLPGIGEYTAGAVASIAYGIPVSAVDGNVLRVLSRMVRCEEDVLDQRVKRVFSEAVTAAMPKDRPGDFNQALMELGATVCVPNGAPLCVACPVADSCEAYRAGDMLAYPVKAAKKPRKIEKRTIVIVVCRVPMKRLPVTEEEPYANEVGLADEASAFESDWPDYSSNMDDYGYHSKSEAWNGGSQESKTQSVVATRKQKNEYFVYLEQRPEKGLLSDLWEFINLEGQLSSHEAKEALDVRGMKPVSYVSLRDAKHIFSHVEWHMTGYLWEVDPLKTMAWNDTDVEWGAAAEIESTFSGIFTPVDHMRKEHALPAAFSAYEAALFNWIRMKEGEEA